MPVTTDSRGGARTAQCTTFVHVTTTSDSVHLVRGARLVLVVRDRT